MQNRRMYRAFHSLRGIFSEEKLFLWNSWAACSIIISHLIITKKEVCRRRYETMNESRKKRDNFLFTLCLSFAFFSKPIKALDEEMYFKTWQQEYNLFRH